MVRQTKRSLSEVNSKEFIYLFKPNVQGNSKAATEKTLSDNMSQDPDVIIVDSEAVSSDDPGSEPEAPKSSRSNENVETSLKKQKHSLGKYKSSEFNYPRKRRQIRKHRSLSSSSKISVGTVPSYENLLAVSKNFRKPISVFNLFIAYWKQKLTNDFIYSDALASYSNMSSLVKSRWKQRAEQINSIIKSEESPELGDGASAVADGESASQYTSSVNNDDSEVKAVSQVLNDDGNSVEQEATSVTEPILHDAIDLAAHFKLMAEAMQGMSSNLRALTKFGSNVTVDNFSSTLLDCAFTSLSILSCLASDVYGSQTRENAVRNSELLKNLAFTMPGLSTADQ